MLPVLKKVYALSNQEKQKALRGGHIGKKWMEKKQLERHHDLCNMPTQKIKNAGYK